MKYLVCLVLSVVFFQINTSHAQESRRYTAIQGLLGTDVTAICENEDFLWIVTNEGLNRFDGKEFKTYKKESNSDNCLSENNIETLMFDSKGLLWIGLKTGGVDIYDPKKDQFIHISKLTKDYPHRVISIFEDSEKNIWLGSWEEGIYKLTPAGDKPLEYKIEKHYYGRIISSIVEKPHGILWVGTYDGYFLHDIHKKEWINTVENHLVISQFLDFGEENTLWCSTWEQGLLRMSWKQNNFTQVTTAHYLQDFQNIYRIYPASENKLYLGTWGEGLKMVDTSRGEVNELPPYRSLIDPPVILCLFRDRYNKFWVGTYGNGLYRVNTEESGIKHLSPINRNGLSAAYKIGSFSENHLLIGTQGDGLYLLNLKSNQLIHKPIHFHRTLFNSYILSLYCDEDLLIVGHDDAGISYASLGKEKNPDFTLKQSFIGDQLAKVTSIHKGKDSRIWLGTKQNGLFSIKYDSKTERFTDFVHYESFGRDEITGFAECEENRLWVSSHSGLYLFNTETNTVDESSGIRVSDMVYSLVDDKKNQCLWLGTSVGLRQLQYKGDDKIESVFSPDLLPEGVIMDVLLDADNNLWFSISDRIFCFVDQEKKLKEINSGIFGNQIIFSSSRAEIESKEYIVFGGADNLILVDPAAALNQPTQTKIVLTELQIDHHKVEVGERVYGKVVLNEATEYTQSISLSYLCKWISLSLTEVGWDYYRNKYQYKIEKFSTTWQYLDMNKPLTFSQLQPGDYTLYIRHYGDVPDNEPCWSLKITIYPPWWKTGWFYVASLLSALLLMIFSIMMVKNHYKKRQQQRLSEINKRKKEELLKEKESFFAGLSHDLLTPFSLIIAPVNDLLREKKMPEENREKLEIISKNASFLSDIFSTILDLKRAEIMDAEIHEKPVELVAFCRVIVHAFDYLSKSKQITLSFRSNVSEISVLTDTVKLERILYNLLSNALKFTPDGGTINVTLSVENENRFVIRVLDSGSGIDAKNLNKIFDKFYQEAKYRNNKQGMGLGLYIVKNFVNMLGGELHIESESGKGTDIRIALPLKYSEKINNPVDDTFQDELPFILLVEDNDQLRNYLKKRLSPHFHVATAANGMEAVEFIQVNLPEIVISDVMMPEMDGLALCNTIKMNPLYSDIFVVLLSARSTTEDELQGYKAGADFYIKKPFDSEVFINQIINVYTTRQKRRKQIIQYLLSPQSTDEEGSLMKDDFLHRAIKVIEGHLMDGNFNMDEFASEMHVSKTVLHRKFKILAGETPNVFIRNVRLHKSADLLKNSDLSISEIAYMTGFSQAHYFIKCFKEVYHETPKNFRKK